MSSGPMALGLVADPFGPATALATAAPLLVAAAFRFARFVPETHRAGRF